MTNDLDAGTVVRSKEVRPTLRQVVGRGLVVVVTNALALWFLAWVVDGFRIDDAASAVAAGW